MRTKIHDPLLIGLVMLAAGLSACASVPPPYQLQDRAEAEVRAARNAGAATNAPDALAEAERRLAAAKQLTLAGSNRAATRKAAEAEAAAGTARARAELAQLDQQIQQQTELNASLEADLLRRQAAAAAAQQALSSGDVPASGASAGLPVSGSTVPDASPWDLPSIQLAPPVLPAPASSTAMPAPGRSGMEGPP